MKVFETIEELIREIKIDREMIFPYFFIFKFDELNYAKRIESFPHFKRFFEISFYEENKNQIQIGHTTVQDLNNSITVTSPMQSLSITRIERPVGFSVLFNAKFFTPEKHQYNILHEFSYFKLNSKPAYKLSEKDLAYIKNLFELMYDEYEKQAPQCLEIIQSYLWILLHYLKRSLNSDSNLVKLSRYDAITSVFETLVLEENGGYKTIAQYANLLHISPVYLSECVKKSTGFSAKKVLSNYQVLRAKSLLIQTEKSVTEIALLMGFDEATNFIKFFKKHTGVTPLVFKRIP